jgi:hypothetical protein
MANAIASTLALAERQYANGCIIGDLPLNLLDLGLRDRLEAIRLLFGDPAPEEL